MRDLAGLYGREAVVFGGADLNQGVDLLMRTRYVAETLNHSLFKLCQL